MKVIFAGTPDFAAHALKNIHEAGFEIVLVLTQPDRPKGRGMQLQASPVKQMALELGLNPDTQILQPEKLKNNHEIINLLNNLNADVMVVAAYGLILPQEVLDAPKHGCLNIHASLLPRWRGAAPIQRAIEAGDEQTGVCIMQMDIGLDTGNIISEHIYPIKQTDTANQVHDELMKLGAQAIVEDLQKLEKFKQLESTIQPEIGVTYAQKLSKEEAKINWSESADVIERKIRAFNPVPTAWTTHENQPDKPIKIWQAKIISKQNQDINYKNGEIIHLSSEGILVACHQNYLLIQELQVSGGKRMNVKDFLLGNPLKLAIGQIFQ